jgi:hypothetical protein
VSVSLGGDNIALSCETGLITEVSNKGLMIPKDAEKSYCVNNEDTKKCNFIKE